MSITFPNIKPMGERALLIEFEPEINKNILKEILLVRDLLISKLPKDKVEVINTYNSLLVNYRYAIEDIYDEILGIKSLLDQAKIEKYLDKLLFHIPVCYDENFGWDLEEISLQKNLSFDDIIQVHCESIYTVYFIGFLPGFLYLGGLPEVLNFPRKNEPRREVPKGAVGIGGNQTGIYPKKSPGGWQIIGNSPVIFFDPKRNPPCQISAGDKVQFFSVSKDEYLFIKKNVKRGNYQLKYEKFHGEN